MFFSFDGMDGVGKSTQMKRFQAWLESQGKDVLVCRDPGSTPLGEKIREILLHSGEETPIHRRAEMLLYMAARAQLVEEIIRPALADGKVVVSDRYLLANIVYQAHAGGLDSETVRHVGTIATDHFMPDLVFLLDMPLETAKSRLTRSLDRMEMQGDAYMERLRTGFLTEAAKFPDSILVVRADQSIDAVHEEICEAAARLL